MKSIINELLQQEGNPKVSIIISTDLHAFADKEKIRLELKNHIDQAAQKLKMDYEEETARKLIRSLKDMAKRVDMSHLEGGIGLYVSPGYQKQVVFPFSVKNKVLVKDYFNLYDLQQTIEKMLDFAVLAISKNQTRLLIGKGNKLNDVDNEYFPMHFENEFQVHRTAPGSFYNEEESEVDQARLKNWFRKVDDHLAHSVKDMPIIIMGVVKHLSEFKQLSKHAKDIIVEISGNYDHTPAHEIAQKIFPLLEDYYEKKQFFV